MSNYRIYFKGTQVSPCPNTTYPSLRAAEQSIAITWVMMHPQWADKLEARPDLDPITVSHGQEQKEGAK